MTTEHLDVLVVGAGLSGIAAGHYLQEECPWADYAIFEARASMGGTWDLFRYPGIRSDSDMFTLGYSFRPWPGEKSIADGDDILSYIQHTAADEGIDQRIRYHHRVLAADWSSDDALWHITAERTDTGEQLQLTARFLFSCSGYYRYDHGHEPEFAGRERFRGLVVHPQQWPHDLDYADKRVVVIGSGATAITLIPALARDAEHVVMLQRSPSYVAALPAKNPIATLIRKVIPGDRGNRVIRWWNAVMTQLFFKISRRFPGFVKRLLRAGLKVRLPRGYDIDTHFTPAYDPWDQRLCVAPDGDLFAAIKKGDASVVTGHIDSFTETGIALTSGQHVDASIIITATGLELLFIGGIEVSVDGEALHLPDRMTYKGMMLEGVPNFAMAVGYTNASWTLKCELTCDHVARLLNHMRGLGMRQATPVNDDASVSAEPLLGLSSGYVQRNAHKFPRQGSRAPWRVHQSYLRDYREMKMAPVGGEGMVFSNPGPLDGRGRPSVEAGVAS